MEIHKGNYANDQIVAGGWCEDDGWATEAWMLGADASASPVVGSSEGIVWCIKGRACDGSGGIGMACSGANRIPRWCWICLKIAVCWVWVAIIYSWWALRVVIYWVRMLWEVANAWKVWHRPLYSEMDIEILGLDEGEGFDIGGITGGSVVWHEEQRVQPQVQAL